MIFKIFSDFLNGLNEIHWSGWAHRDIKPQNILIDLDTCEVLISDFGLAGKLCGMFPNSKTTSGKLYDKKGTPYYMAPELWYMSGDPSVNMINESSCAGKQTDIYASGIILIELFISELPYKTSEELFEFLNFL